jgi:hypothetical protein
MLTDEQIDVLADGWPWPNSATAEAIRLAEEEGWPLDDTVRALDTLAEEFGVDGHPLEVVQAAIQVQRGQRQRP